MRTLTRNTDGTTQEDKKPNHLDYRSTLALFDMLIRIFLFRTQGHVRCSRCFRQCESTRVRCPQLKKIRPQGMSTSKCFTGAVNRTHCGRAHLPCTLRRIVSFTSHVACTLNTDMRVKEGCCCYGDPQPALARCHSRTTQTIQRLSPSTLSTAIRSPSTSWTYPTAHSRSMSPFGVWPNKPHWR